MVERRALYVTAFVRAVTTSLVGVLLGVYLARLGVTGGSFGTVVSSGLVGAALAAVAATFFGDVLGRRRFLMLLTLLWIVGTVAFAWSNSPATLAAAAFVGMLNGMGKDRGAALILEQAALPGTTSAEAARRSSPGTRCSRISGSRARGGAALAGLPTLLLLLLRALRRRRGRDRRAVLRRAADERRLASRRSVAREADRSREHRGLHAHPAEPLCRGMRPRVRSKPLESHLAASPFSWQYWRR